MLTKIHLIFLLSFVALLSCGQILFKISALGMAGENGFGAFRRLALAPSFYLGLGVYALATIIWIWILREVPFSKAYPFVILTFVVTPILGAYFFQESLTLRYFVGMFVLIVGLAIMSN